MIDKGYFTYVIDIQNAELTDKRKNISLQTVTAEHPIRILIYNIELKIVFPQIRNIFISGYVIASIPYTLQRFTNIKYVYKVFNLK